MLYSGRAPSHPVNGPHALRANASTMWMNSSEQQGCHLMIWSDNDVANDFTTMKDQNGDQAYPPAFLQVGIEMYRDYQRLLWDTSLTSG